MVTKRAEPDAPRWKAVTMNDQILQFLFEIATYGGGSATIAYLLFRYLGKSWIESKFSERLASFKHQQDIEIQRLRVEIDSTLSGVLKSQEKEFETLSEAWNKLDEAYAHVKNLVSPLQYHPNLDGMTEARLKEFLDETDLRDTEKGVIYQSSEKSNEYQEIVFWHRLHQVKLACSDLDKCVVRYGIFFPPNLKEQFNEIVNELNSTVLDKEVGQETKDYKLQSEGWKKIGNKIDPLFKAIGSDIHARLQWHGRSQ
jgi:hypothetical protein